MGDHREIVKITYLDHVETKNVKDDEIEKVTPVECTIFGEVVKETPHFITVRNYSEKQPSYKIKLENYAMTIVKSTIIRREELTTKR